MKHVLLLLLLLLIYGMTGFAQKKVMVSGQLTDSLQKQKIENATVSLVSAEDSSLIGFTRADENGKFSFRNISPGNYRISASHVNFHPYWKNFSVTAGQNDLDLGELKMYDKSLMKDILVESEKPPVSVNGDTLEFNAASFKTKPNAVVEDLLKKMPGVEVDKDGTIRVNGQRISQVYVNGKQFFGNDPKIATRNLDADALEKVQFFDKKSDQSEFTGIDDGNNQKALNLKLKKDKIHATFGKVTAGVGNNDRYEGQFNVNRFNGNQQLSAIGMANNTNTQGFTFQDILDFTGELNRMMRSGGGGRMIINSNGPDDYGLPVQGMGNGQGIAQTIAGGLNFNDTWKKKTEVSGSYFYNNIDLSTEKNINRQNLVPGNSFNYQQKALSNSRTESNRFNTTVDSKIDSFNAIRFTAALTHQNSNSRSNNNYSSILPDDTMLNEGFTNSGSKSEGYNLNSNLLFKHKFKKKSRTFSANLSWNYNDSRNDGVFKSINSFFNPDGSTQSKDTLDQINNTNSLTNGYGVNLSYTEPLSKRSLIEIAGFYNQNKGKLDKKTYDLNNATGKHDDLNDVLSNAFESEYDFTGASLNYRAQKKKLTYGFGATLQTASLKSNMLDNNSIIKQHFTNVLPAANLTYQFTRSKSIQFSYTTSTRQPGTSQLQPVQDISDPLNIREGNPNLKQEYQHNLSLNYFSASPMLGKHLMFFSNFSLTNNSIVNADEVNDVGARKTTYQNTNGVYNAFANIEWGSSIKAIKGMRFNLALNGLYYNNISFINGSKNKIGNSTLRPEASLSYNYKDKITVDASARLGYNEIRYSLLPEQNENYWRNEYTLETNLGLPWDLNINSDITYSQNNGRANGYNTNTYLWNASLTKQFLKFKRAAFKVSVFDILNQNIGINRNANLNYIEDVSYKVLNRYFLASFTYNLSKASNSGPNIRIKIN